MLSYLFVGIISTLAIVHIISYIKNFSYNRDSYMLKAALATILFLLFPQYYTQLLKLIILELFLFYNSNIRTLKNKVVQSVCIALIATLGIISCLFENVILSLTIIFIMSFISIIGNGFLFLSKSNLLASLSLSVLSLIVVSSKNELFYFTSIYVILTLITRIIVLYKKRKRMKT